MIKKTVMLSSTLFFIAAGITFAHPGNTDSNGGHTCKTNCPKWGLKYGEYHYHNGGSSGRTENDNRTGTVDTRSAKEKEADEFIGQAEYYQKLNNSYNALYYLGKASDAGYSYKVTDKARIVAQKVSEEAYAFYLDEDLEKSLQYYILLAENSKLSPSLAENAKKNIQLIEEKITFLDKFAEARWYQQEEDYFNALLLANALIEDVHKNSFASSFINDVAEKLLAQAYEAFEEQKYERSLEYYKAIAELKYVPNHIKTNAANNVNVVEKYISKLRTEANSN